jgi:hypothetical protein
MMQKTLLVVALVTSLLSCQIKEKLIKEELRQWEGRWVTKTCYDSLLKKHTTDFVENYIKNNPATDSIPSPCQ